ncbi:MAG TPA: NHLP bacteriocin export ABC transporter permease/ATPase subunit [Steroidobacteraceae bacterium]|nr:NHLP bacteriocin export ABC transporter permease/ATPase subunit [Steroidobacteraceae bacterium]
MSNHRIVAGALGDRTGRAPVIPQLQRLVLDGRIPRLLDHRGYALQVVAGHVDLFAVRFVGESTQGARHHLFRVETGGIILDLPELADASGERVHVIAVGGRGAEAVMMPRQQIESFGLVAAWIGSVGTVLAGPNVDWTIREAEMDQRCELAAGERRRGPAQDILWVSVESGNIRLMGVEPAYLSTSPPALLASGMWIEAGEQPSAIVVSRESPTGANDLWSAIDRFHLCAMVCIQASLAGDASREAQRLLRRIEISRSQTIEVFEQLSAVIARRPESARASTDAYDPLLAACRLVGDAINAPIVRPAERMPGRQEFENILEIARASQLRVRRTLLRANWWKQDIGPLIAWRGDERKPVALLPGSRRRYVMVEPGSGVTRAVNEAVAAELSMQAAMFYRTLPARPLSLRDLLVFSIRTAPADLVRIVAGGALLGLLSLAAPLIIHLLVDSVIPRTELDQLAFCAAALAVTALAMAGAQIMQGIAMLRLEGVLDWKLQAAVIDRLLRMPASFFRQYTVGDLVARSLGIDAIRRVFTGHTLRSLLAGMFCWFSFLLMFYYEYRLALIATVLTIIRAILILAVTVLRLYHETQHFNLQGKLEGFVLQLLAGIGKLRVAAATIRALAVWTKQFGAQKRHFIVSQRAANALGVVETSFPLIATLIIFAAAEIFGSPLTRDVGAFLAFFVAFGQAIGSIGEWATAVGDSLIAIPHLSRIRPLIGGTLEFSEDRRSGGELSGSFELSRVTFRYAAGGPPVLDNITLRVAAGEYVAIVGPSGSGKSTVFRLLLGFEKLEAGAIFFDGKAIDTLDISVLRRQMGVVLQNGKLTSGSIYENICGGMQLPVEQVREAVRLAGMEGDLDAMPMGIHTMIAEGVSTISGGQRQRLMIARAIARRPRILLFDEATSALDNQTQAIVSDSLGRLNVTRIVIAHRLSTVRHAQRIIVLVEGKIVQTGTFAELSEPPGVFADLIQRQLL